MAKENYFLEPFRTIKAIQILRFIFQTVGSRSGSLIVVHAETSGNNFLPQSNYPA